MRRGSELKKLSSAVLIWLSWGWSRKTVPGASASDSRCAKRRRWGEGSSTKQCGVRSSEWWGGRRWMRRQMEGGSMGWKEKVLPKNFGTKSLGISGPMLWGSVNYFCTFLLKFSFYWWGSLSALQVGRLELPLLSNGNKHCLLVPVQLWKSDKPALPAYVLCTTFSCSEQSPLSLLEPFSNGFSSFFLYLQGIRTCRARFCKEKFVMLLFPCLLPLSDFMHFCVSFLIISLSLSPPHCLEKVLPNGNTPMRQFLLYYPHFIVTSARWVEGWLSH